jgi:hypothetical protein
MLKTSTIMAFHFEISRFKKDWDTKIIARDLMPLISPSRYQNKCHRLHIGQALYSIFGREQRGLAMWIRYTNEAKGDYKECRSKWDAMCHLQELKTIRTIAYYASSDAPERYEKWHEHASKFPLSLLYPEMNVESLTVTEDIDDIIVDIFYRSLWLNFACYRNNIYYHYGEGVWDKADDTLKKFLNLLLTFIVKTVVLTWHKEHPSFYLIIRISLRR